MAVVGEFVLTVHDDGSVTGWVSEAGQHASATETVKTVIPGSVVVEDPWGTQAAAPAAASAAVAVAAPACVHGPLKAVKGGIAGPNSRNPGKAYGPFWACPAPRGQQCRLDPKTLPPAPA